jgi:hypothetical protein
MVQAIVDPIVRDRLANVHDDYRWLEFDKLPDNLPLSPLEKLNVTSIDQTYTECVEMFCNTKYLSFFCKHILGFEPLPFQSVVLDTLWSKKYPILLASRGAGKTTILAVYCLLRMAIDPGSKIVIVSGSFRQARQVFEQMKSCYENSPVLRDICRNREDGPKRELDRFEFRIGKSICYALPLGDGTTIRGFRANHIIVDECALVPHDILSTVVEGFGAVSKDPVSKVKEHATVTHLKKAGKWTREMEDLRELSKEGNQIIYAGTAYYSFNHFYEYYMRWCKIIGTGGDPDKIKKIFGDDKTIQKGFNWKDFAVIRIPYDALPEGFLDPGIIAKAKATMHTGLFFMEFGATFISDTNGFFRRTLIESCTTTKPVRIKSGRLVQFSAKKFGDSDKRYIMGIDPAAYRDNAAVVILELDEDHRKVVYCWTANQKKFNELKKKGLIKEDDYYRYVARHIRDLMQKFNICRIAMDKHGGGTAIAEALKDRTMLGEHEVPIYEVIEPDKEKATDFLEGLHILKIIVPTNEINSRANHGMLKDFQDRTLIFPAYDSIEFERFSVLDKAYEETPDTAEDTYTQVIEEIEELKNEITNIICKPSASLGQETFDTPDTRSDAFGKSVRSPKDRYSALLYANLESRDDYVGEMEEKFQYKAVGGTRATISSKQAATGSMYYGKGVKRMQNSNWINRGGTHIKHN